MKFASPSIAGLNRSALRTAALHLIDGDHPFVENAFFALIDVSRTCLVAALRPRWVLLRCRVAVYGRYTSGGSRWPRADSASPILLAKSRTLLILWRRCRWCPKIRGQHPELPDSAIARDQMLVGVCEYAYCREQGDPIALTPTDRIGRRYRAMGCDRAGTDVFGRSEGIFIYYRLRPITRPTSFSSVCLVDSSASVPHRQAAARHRLEP
jgi:hypothetical protein